MCLPPPRYYNTIGCKDKMLVLGSRGGGGGGGGRRMIA